MSLRQHWHDTAWIGQFYCAQVEIRRGNLSEAKAQLESVRELSPEGRDPEMVARVLFGLASIARYQHKFDEAFELYGESCRYFAFAGRADGEASCWRDMGALEISLGNPDQAEKLYRRAYHQYEKLGKRHEMANCVNGLAEVARLRDQDREAEDGYLRAIDL